LWNTSIVTECLQHGECDSSNTLRDGEQLVCKDGDATTHFSRPTQADIMTYQLDDKQKYN
jgi:hypothetical protein